MTRQPELSVADFFAFGNAAAAHASSLPQRRGNASDQPEEAEFPDQEDK